MAKPKGKYKRLVESQNRDASTVEHGLQTSKSSKKKTKEEKNTEKEEEEEEEPDWKKQIEEEELSAFSLSRARQMAAPDTVYLLAGSLGALMAGGVFPMWGLLFAGTWTCIVTDPELNIIWSPDFVHPSFCMLCR